MSLEIFLLGQFKLTANQLPVELPSRPAQSLLAYLALNVGVELRREKLSSLLWPEANEANARSYLRQALWRLRRSLESAALQWEDYLDTGEISLCFKPKSDYWLDVDQLLRPAEGRPLDEIIAEIRLYRGELLPGFYDDWIGLERDRVQAAYYRKMTHLLERLIQARQWDAALSWAEQWILHGYSPEPAYQAIMQAYAGLGNLAMVATTYQRCTEAVARELGVDPSPETTRLYEHIRQGQWRLPQTTLEPDFPVPPNPARLPPFLLDEGRDLLHLDKTPTIARERELEQMENHLNLAIKGQGRVVFITGEAGSGKTTLLNEFARRARNAHPDLISASGNCNAYTGIGDPYLPFREVLELLTGDVEARWLAGAISRRYATFLWNMIPNTVRALVEVGPDLIGTFVPSGALLERAAACAPGKADWLAALERLISQKITGQLVRSPHQSDLFIEYTRVLQVMSRQSPLVLLLDDLQWADVGSLSLLFHLGRQLPGSRILVIGAYRPEEVALGRAGERHPLEPVVNELQRMYGEIEVNVDLAESQAFIDGLIDSEPNRLGPQFREMLLGLTRGHPLFTIELLRGMQERGDLLQDEQGFWIEGAALDWEAFPARVEAVIAERIGRLDQRLQACMRAASVEGEIFTAEVVAHVGGCAEAEILSQLSNELNRKHRLIRPQSIQRIDGQLLSSYRFRHTLVQKYLYNSLDETERVRLHEQVGTVLEGLYQKGAGAESISPQLARHFQEAQVVEKALLYLLQSGTRALHVSAYQEAINNLQRGLALLSSLPDTRLYIQQELELQLNLSIALHLAKGFFDPQIKQAAVRALDLSKQVGNTIQLCQTLSNLSILYYVQGDHPLSLALSEELLAIGTRAGDPQLAALGHWSLGIVYCSEGRFSKARFHLEQAVSNYDFRRHHQQFVMLRGVDAALSSMAYLGDCLWYQGYLDQARRVCRQALELAGEANHAFTRADVLRYGGCELDLIRRDGLSLKAYAEELVSISEEKNFLAWLGTGRSCLGAARVILGEPREGIPLIEDGIAYELSVGVHCTLPGPLCYLAEAYARLGDPERSLQELDRAFNMVEQTGELSWESELYRRKGQVLLLLDDPAQAEATFCQALQVARQQEARWWELRVAIALGRLWVSQGKRNEARGVISQVYDWFTEGFDVPELVEARELLEELS